jgi:hypothetical protein
MSSLMGIAAWSKMGSQRKPSSGVATATLICFTRAARFESPAEAEKGGNRTPPACSPNQGESWLLGNSGWPVMFRHSLG